MDIRNSRDLKQNAAKALSGAAYDPRKLALIHGAVSLGVAFIIALADYFLNHQIEGTGGLSGMGLRSVLGTVQMTLQYALSLALPFWELGFVYAALQMARGQRADVSSLPEGFRRFGPVLRLRLLQGFLYLGVGMISMYAGGFLFSVTPFARPMMELVMPVIEEGTTIEQMELAIMGLPTDALIRSMIPFFVIFGLLFCVLALLLFYRFRVADFLIMDEPRIGALQAMVGSSRLTRGRKWALVKLDLSFWWFYLLMVVAMVVSYGDVLLPLLGIALPFSSDAAWFVFYLLGILAQLALLWYGHSYVQTTWAGAYDVLRQTVQQAPPPQQPPKKLPWDDYNRQA